VLPVKARPVVPSAIHSLSSAHPAGSTGCAHFDVGMGAALLVTADEDSGVVEVEVDTLVVNKMSLEGDAALEVIEVDAALDSNEVLTGVDTEATDV
jgi:hypothetical protein